MTYDHTDAVTPISGNPTIEEMQMIRLLEPIWYEAQVSDFWQIQRRPAESTLFHTNPHTRIGY